MNRTRRLGRGLEALLGRVAGQGDPSGTPPPEHKPDQADAGPHDAAGVVPSALDVASESLPYPGHGATPGSPGDLGLTSADGTASTGETPPVSAGPSPLGNGTSDAGPLCVHVERIESNPFQPRHDFDLTELGSLSESLRAHGLLQPLVVRRLGDRYQLIAGERRFRAARQAGWTEVPVQVVEADDRQVAELAIVENLQRKDLNPLEKAASFQRYLEQYGGTQEELAARLKIDRSTIANLIRLLELPEPVREAIRQQKITQGHARALLPLGDEPDQIAFCERIQREGLSVRRTEALVQETIEQADAELLRLVGRDGTTSRARRVTSEHIAALEQEFRTALGTKVKITHSSRGRGKLVIHFTSHEEFERIRRHICDAGPPHAQAQVG